MNTPDDISLRGEAMLLLIGAGLWIGMLVMFFVDCGVVVWRALCSSGRAVSQVARERSSDRDMQ